MTDKDLNKEDLDKIFAEILEEVGEDSMRAHLLYEIIVAMYNGEDVENSLAENFAGPFMEKLRKLIKREE